MRLVTLILFFILQTNNSYAKDKCQDQGVCIKLKNGKNLSSEIRIINNSPYKASVKIDITPKNILKAPKEFPQTLILEGHQIIKQNIKFNKLSISQPYRTLYSWMHGDYRLTRSNFAYRLPYKIGTSHTVGQSFNGVESHNGRTANAIDWNMKVGTNIHAARSGYVVKVVNKFRKGGKTKHYMDKSNFIKILHDDGSFSIYAHLKHLGTLVKENQRVSQGQVIGNSGNTGFSSGPHLHFHVGIPAFIDKAIVEQTIPFNFSNCKQKMFVPLEGKKYTNC